MGIYRSGERRKEDGGGKGGEKRKCKEAR